MANPKKRGKFIIVCLIIVVSLVLALLFAFKKKELPVVVQTVKVAKRNITEIVVASGKIQPVIEVHISPEVSGEIIEMPVKEGQFVHKNDLLLKINPKTPLAESSFDYVGKGWLARAALGLPLDERIRAANIYVKLSAGDVKAAFAKWIRPADLVQITQGPPPQ